MKEAKQNLGDKGTSKETHHFHIQYDVTCMSMQLECFQECFIRVLRKSVTPECPTTMSLLLVICYCTTNLCWTFICDCDCYPISACFAPRTNKGRVASLLDWQVKHIRGSRVQPPMAQKSGLSLRFYDSEVSEGELDDAIGELPFRIFVVESWSWPMVDPFANPKKSFQNGWLTDENAENLVGLLMLEPYTDSRYARYKWVNCVG